MQITKTSLPNLFVINFKQKKDKRGSFTRVFCEDLLRKKTNFKIKQFIISKNLKSKTLRGFHFQSSKFSEKKIIIPIKGKVLFQIININKKSKYYLKKFSIILAENDNKALLVPTDCATGFMTLKRNTHVLYLMSNFYNPKYSKGILYNDKKINIKWPFRPRIISKKDLSYDFLK